MRHNTDAVATREESHKDEDHSTWRQLMIFMVVGPFKVLAETHLTDEKQQDKHEANNRHHYVWNDLCENAGVASSKPSLTFSKTELDVRAGGEPG
mmetsp:Transcript_11109/g.19428  ORF Transcript_11109/g.19428 Transcript_11109/m.19428 type:complete len:95 (-) Transcript_11109:299-583(-)